MKEYWVTNSRWKLIVVIMLLMWLGIMVLLYLKADEVTKNPCQICAKKIGEDILCTYSKGGIVQSIIFYPNYSIEHDRANVLPKPLG